MAKKTRRRARQQRFTRAGGASDRRVPKAGPATIDSVQAQRARYYELKRSGYSNAEAASKANQEASTGLGEASLTPRAVRSADREENRASTGLAARSRQLKGRSVQHDPTKTRTPKAGRVARMMTPDEDELGTEEEALTAYKPAMVHTHEGREPPKEEEEDAETYHAGDETVNDEKSKLVSNQLLGGRRARMRTGTSQEATRIPDNWETMPLAKQKALAKQVTGSVVTTKNQASAILRREQRRQSRS